MSLKNNYCNDKTKTGFRFTELFNYLFTIYLFIYLLIYLFTESHFVYLHVIETNLYLILFCQLGFKLTKNCRKNWAAPPTQQR